MTTKTLALLEAIKKDIEGGAYNALPDRYGAICDLINACKDDLAKKAAKAAGKTDLLKACKSILKSAGKGCNKALHGVTTIENRSYVCDGYRIISFPAGAVDLPGLPDNVKPLELNKILEKARASYTDTIALPDAAFLASDIKVLKASEKAAGRKPAHINAHFGNIAFNAEFLLDMLRATGANTGYISGPKAPVYIANNDNDIECMLLPVHVATTEPRDMTLYPVY